MRNQGIDQAAIALPSEPWLADSDLRRRRFLCGTALFATSAGTGAGAGVTKAVGAPATDRSGGVGAASACFAYVGCRTTRERNARGDGINVYRMDTASGRWDHVQLLSGLVNPSFLAFDRTRRFLYAVHGDSSEVSSYRIDSSTGRITPINQQSTQGRNPVHLGIDPTNRFMVVANHVTGTLAVLPVREDGSLGAVIDLVTLEGQIGPHRVEQPFAKPHQVEFDPTGRFIIVPDKGLDRVFTFRLDHAGKLIAADPPSVQARETSGPRHIAFHPALPFAYVINELDSTLAAYRYDAATGTLGPFQIISSLPDSFTGNSRASEIGISPDGRFLYGSNRGFDSVAAFAIDQADGRLTSLDFAHSAGKTPRFFTFDPSGRFMYVANEESDTIVKFTVHQASGKITPTDDVISTGSPVCIVFRPAGT